MRSRRLSSARQDEVAELYGSTIRFRCPQCLADLKARARKAGTPQRCPRCQFVFKVPSAEEAASQAARPEAAGEYAVWDAAKQRARDEQASFSITCGVCRTRMDATVEQVGHEIVCPDCGTATVVPAPEPEKEKPAPVVAGTDDEYAMCEGVDQPDASNQRVHQTYVSVVCPVCGTRMLATLDQVGQEIACPDCHVRTVVPPPPAAPAQRPPELEIDRHDEYGMAAGRDQPAAPPAGKRYVKVPCPHCHTRLPATADQAGQQIVCPDCGTTTMVPEPEAPAPRLGPEIDVREEYGVGEPIETPGLRRVDDYRHLDRSDVAPAEGQAPAESEPGSASEPSGPPSVRPGPPRWTFLSGIFNFPVYPGVRLRWLSLSAGATPVLLGLAAGVSLLEHNTPPSLFAGMALIAFFGVLAVVWSAPATAICLAVVEETSEGNDRIEHWPEAVFADWMFRVFYLVNSLAVGTGGGVLLRGVLEWQGWPSGQVVPGTVIATFPVLLLSMLEANSALNVVSRPVWRSLIAAWWAWAMFYLETTIVVAGSVALAGAARALMGWSGVALIAPVLVAGMLIYARLLGRLGWVCIGLAAEAESSA